MIITQQDIIFADYLFLILGGLIALFGGIVVFLNKKGRKKGVN